MSLLTRSLSLVTCLAAATVAAPSADAGNVRTITSGLSCVQAYGYAEARTFYGDDGGFYSDAPDGFRTAVCALPQVSPLYLGATVGVDVLDRNYNGDISCRVVTRAATWTSWGAGAASNGSSTATQRLNVQGTTPWATAANVHLLCYLPPVYLGNRSALIGFDAIVNAL